MPFVKGQSGNPAGRPKKPVIDSLEKAIKKVQKEKNEKFLNMVIKRAYESDQVLIAVLKKIIPDIKTTDLKISTDPDNPPAWTITIIDPKKQDNKE